ncbi:MAG: c-type cytochrome [Pseudomonadaceae bacterium]|nr:c-type cytochrome [Pseudomonadaceae bacterium]
MRLTALILISFAWTNSSAETSIERGEYLTNILGCGGCHTEGALLGNPTGQWLAGSRIGIAYTEDLDDISPGIVFPGNLTADKETGLGRWSKDDIKTFLLTGMDHYGKQATTVMPWPNYAYLQDQDLDDIAAFLKQLAPIKQTIPASITAGAPVNNAFVRIGVYLFVPEEDTERRPNPPGELND